MDHNPYPMGLGFALGMIFPRPEDFSPQPKSEKELILEKARKAREDEPANSLAHK